MIVDDKYVIVGLPAEVGEKQPTRRGFKIPSETLSKILDEVLERYRDAKNSIGYDEFLREVIEKYEATHPGISIETIANYLKLPAKEIQRINESTIDSEQV